MYVSDRDINIQEICVDEGEYLEDWNENERVVCGENDNVTKQKINQMESLFLFKLAS